MPTHISGRVPLAALYRPVKSSVDPKFAQAAARQAFGRWYCDWRKIAATGKSAAPRSRQGR